MTIKLTDHLMDIHGKAYLPVAPRVVAFRERFPDWAIVTEYAEYGGAWLAVAYVQDADGNVVSKAHKEVQSFKVGGKDASWTKAETGAVGRALSLIGIGTLEALDLDEGDEIADSPIAHGSTPPEPDGGRPNSPPVQSGRPADPETVKGWLLAKAERSNSTDRISDKQLRLLTWKLHDAVEPYSAMEVLIYVFGIGEPHELTKAQAGAVLDWLLDEQTEDGYSIYGREEARKIARTE